MSLVYAGELSLVRYYFPTLDYVLSVPAINLAVSLTDVKTHLRLSDGTAEDAYLTSLVTAITDYAEKYTRRDFVNKTYIGYMDKFPPFNTIYNPADNGKILIRRSKLQSISSVKYYTNNILTTIDPAQYYITNEPDFSAIYLFDGNSWPDVDTRKQAVQVTFVAGYGVDDTAVPYNLKLGMLEHIAAIYENRGDCMDCSQNIPAVSKLVYEQYKIINVG